MKIKFVNSLVIFFQILARISLDQEFGCLATRLKESPLAVSEFRILIRHILTLGLSFAIRHVESGRIVAAIACLVYVRHMETF